MAWTKKEQELVQEIRTSFELLKQRMDALDQEAARLRDLELRLTKIEERKVSHDQLTTRFIAIMAVAVSVCAILVNLVIAIFKK